MWEATPGCGGAPFLDTLWTAVDEAIELPDCDVYSYKSDGEADPFGAAPLRQCAARQPALGVYMQHVRSSETCQRQPGTPASTALGISGRDAAHLHARQ